MKKLILLTLIIASISFGQYRKSAMEAWYNDVVKARITSLISDSISAMTTDARDSLTVNQVVRFGGLSNYNARASVKNDAVKPTILQLTNSRNTVVAKVDSVGLATVVGLTTTGAITATSQTIASGAITASGTSAFTKAQIGAGGSGSGRSTIDSVITYGTNDSLAVYVGGVAFILRHN